jgi:hypothetical protein
MSHTLTPTNGLTERWVILTIVNYATGGEPVAPTEIDGVTAVDAILIGTVPANQNSLGVPLFPVLNSGKIQLFRFVSGSPAEVPPTTGLNAVMPILVHASGIV